MVEKVTTKYILLKRIKEAQEISVTVYFGATRETLRLTKSQARLFANRLSSETNARVDEEWQGIGSCLAEWYPSHLTLVLNTRRN